MRYFNPTNREYVEPIPLSQLQQSADYLTQRHDKAIELYSQIDQALASMDLNDNEAEWVVGKRNEIADILQSGTVGELSAFAVEDLVKGRNKVLFGPDTLGRLKRQQAWKANNDKIDKMNLTEDYKRIFKELNPYGQYQDRYDKNGNLIEGEAYKPNVNPVNTVPINTILDNALKWAAKESGGGSQARWVDINGNVTTDPSQSATGEIFSNTTGKWERLSPEKLKEAIEASINIIPGARESLRQDYDIAKWKYNNGEDSDIIGSDGTIMTPTEYLNARTTPFIKAAQYYNQSSQTQYGDALKTQMQLARKGAYGIAAGAESNGTPTNNHIDMLQGKSDMITIKNTMPTEAKGNLNIAKQTVNDVLKQLGVKKNVDEMTSDEIKQIMTSRNVPAKIRFNVLNALDSIQENTEYLNSIRDSLGTTDEKLQFDAYNTIVSGSNDNSDNKYVKQYNNYVNSLYNGDSSIGQSFSDEDTYNEFLAQLGGENAAKDLGIKIVVRDGKRSVELPKEYSKNLHLFTQAANAAYNKTHNWFGDIWNQTKNFINAGWGDNLYTVDDNGNVNYDILRRAGDVVNSNFVSKASHLLASETFSDAFNDISKITSTTARNGYQGINNFINSLQQSYDTSIGNSGNLTLSNVVLTEATPDMAEISIMMKNNPEAASKLNTVYKLSKEQAQTAVRGFSPVQHGLYVISDNGTFQNVSSADRMTYSNRLKNTKADDLIMLAAQDPKTGNWGIQVTIPGYTDNEGKIKSDPVTVFMPDITNSTYESWNADSSFKAKNEINKFHAANRNVPIITNIFNLPDNITLVPNGSGFAVKKGNNEIIGNIDKAEAIHYRDMYNQYNILKNAVVSGDKVNADAAKALLSNITADICKLYNITTEEGAQEVFDSISKF